MMKGETGSGKRDKIYFLIVVPTLFLLMIFVYILAERLSENNGKICNYLGKIWLNGSQGDPTSLRGCYTYEQLAQMEKL